MLAIFELINRITVMRLIDPELYYRGSIELIFVSCLISFFITFLFNRDYLDWNFSMKWGHYNNICTLFDEPPAKYFVAPLFMLASYCGIRYSVTDYQRMYRSSYDFLKNKSLVVNSLHALAMIIFPMLLIITPDVNHFWRTISHTFIFIYLIFTNTLVVVFRYYTAYLVKRSQLNCFNLIYLFLYIVFTIGYISCFILMFNHLLPNKWVFMFFDYSWVLTFFLSEFFLLDLIDELPVSPINTIRSNI